MLLTSDKARLLDHFRKDPVLFAYHIGDLDAFHFDLCHWAVLPDEAGWIEECVLIYSGLEQPTVLAFGVGDRFEEYLGDLLPELPESFYGHFQGRSREVFASAYDVTDSSNNHKMRLDELRPARITLARDGVQTLDASRLAEIGAFYKLAYPGNFFVPRMLETGKYLGYYVNTRLVAVTGVHVYSEEFKVCALGNITTHPDFRGRGIATQLTSLLLEDMVVKNLSVCLNVKANNAAAIRSYEKLGFVKVHEYHEGQLKRR